LLEGPVCRNIKLTLAYDGTAYHGWQVQCAQHEPTVQGMLEKSLSVLTREHVRIEGAGRTDAGVHAMGQAASFLTGSRIPIEAFPAAINSVLPKDIVVTNAQEMPLDFNARFSAKGKSYRYQIYHRKYPDPFLRNFAFHYPYPLDTDVMEQAAHQYIGKFDWRSFCASGSGRKEFVRTVVKSQIRLDGPMVLFEVTANGFLYNMVRVMVGTLLLAGRGKIKPGMVRDIILAQERKHAGPTVPSHGLYLVEVIY